MAEKRQAHSVDYETSSEMRRIILKLILEKYVMKMWTEVIGFDIAFNGELL
jgi:hypothetical protein